MVSTSQAAEEEDERERKKKENEEKEHEENKETDRDEEAKEERNKETYPMLQVLLEMFILSHLITGKRREIGHGVTSLVL
jgi:Mg2+/citrate symporter